MHLSGSCHCGSVRYTVESDTPYPFMRCYCSICRKTAGTGGYAINLGARADTMHIHGAENLTVYRAVVDGEQSTGERNFCSRCGTALWLFDPTWPELIHPHAGSVDTPLPVPPEHVHLMLDSAASWVEPDVDATADQTFGGYPAESIEQWHRSRGLYQEDGE